MAFIHIHDFGGGGVKPMLILLHGLLGTSRNLAVVARAFVGTRRVIGLDMRNHGESSWENSHRYQDLAEDVANTLQSFDTPYDLLGHSMGGKAAMAGVLAGILKPRKLVVGDIAPVSYAHTQAHVIAAMQAVDLNAFTRKGPLAHHLSEVLGDPAIGPFLAQAADFSGPPRWTHNLEVLAAEMDDIVGFPSLDQTSDQEVLFISGGASNYVQEDLVKSVFPKAAFHWIEGAGHWVHAEAPDQFNTAASGFLG
ncbi:MAG: alpha/beta fold hydrolase [Pseudomonadota bacterium]